MDSAVLLGKVPKQTVKATSDRVHLRLGFRSRFDSDGETNTNTRRPTQLEIRSPNVMPFHAMAKATKRETVDLEVSVSHIRYEIYIYICLWFRTNQYLSIYLFIYLFIYLRKPLVFLSIPSDRIWQSCPFKPTRILRDCDYHYPLKRVAQSILCRYLGQRSCQRILQSPS